MKSTLNLSLEFDMPSKRSLFFSEIYPISSTIFSVRFEHSTSVLGGDLLELYSIAEIVVESGADGYLVVDRKGSTTSIESVKRMGIVHSLIREMSLAQCQRLLSNTNFKYSNLSHERSIFNGFAA